MFDADYYYGHTPWRRLHATLQRHSTVSPSVLPALGLAVVAVRRRVFDAIVLGYQYRSNMIDTITTTNTFQVQLKDLGLTLPVTVLSPSILRRARTAVAYGPPLPVDESAGGTDHPAPDPPHGWRREKREQEQWAARIRASTQYLCSNMSTRLYPESLHAPDRNVLEVPGPYHTIIIIVT